MQACSSQHCVECGLGVNLWSLFHRVHGTCLCVLRWQLTVVDERIKIVRMCKDVERNSIHRRSSLKISVKAEI